MDLDQQAATVGRRQRALITKAQAERIGFTRAQIAQRLRTRRWEVLRLNVYAFAGAPRTWEQVVQATILSLGDGVVASHDTALRLYGGRISDGVAIEVSAWRSRRIEMTGVRSHRSLLLFDADRAVRQGIAVTSTARLVIDLSSRRSRSELGRVVDDLQRRKLLRLPRVAQCLNRLGPAPGRSPATVQAVLAARWPGYDAGDSDLESRVLRLLVAHGLPIPRQQVRVALPGRRCYIDLAYPPIMLAIEIDSWSYHRYRSEFDGDRAKGNELVLLGWHVVRITDGMSDAEIIDFIGRALEALGDFAVA